MKTKLLTHLNFTPSALREITIRVDKVNGINLGQGVCLLPVPELVREAARRAITDGLNRYSPAYGIPELRECMAHKLNEYNRIPCHYNNVIVSAGSSGAFEVVCSTFLSKGDEIILFTPFYPYHNNVPVRKGAVVKTVPLIPPNWSFDVDKLDQAISPRTKFILICTPGNPSGKVFSAEELSSIAHLCIKHNVCCLTDEVYEHMTYDGHVHTSMASLPGMFERTITMGSYSKTFAVTGWRVGYLCAPQSVIKELNCLQDQVYVCAPTPFQHAVAAGIKGLDQAYYDDLKATYTKKRALTRQALVAAGLVPIIPQGAYYMIGDISKRFPNTSADEVLDLLIDQARVGAIPASEFIGRQFKDDPDKNHFFRFSYSVPDEVLMQAGENLAKL